MKVYIGNERDFRNAFPNLLQRHCSVVVRNSETDNLATGANHLLDLGNRRVNVSRISLGHRLNNDRRATANLEVSNLNWF
jgi:hypothetical protein